MPKTVSESRWLGPRSKYNPITNQLSRWSMRIGNRTLRDLGGTAAGKAISGASTGLLVFEGFYDWGVIGMAAYNAISFDDSECK